MRFGHKRVWLFCFLPLLLLRAALADDFLKAAEWGKYALRSPSGATRNLVLLFSDDGGVTDVDKKIADRLVTESTAVALIDSHAYRAWIARQRTGCLDLRGAVAWTAQFLEHRLGLADFHPPLLAGRGLGASIVYALLVQGHKGDFAGGMSLDFNPDRTLPGTLCGFAIGAPKLSPATVATSWKVAAAKGKTAAFFLEQAARINPDRVSELSDSADIAQVASGMLGRAAERVEGDLTDMPVIEVSSKSDKGLLAIIYSGDGGWRDIDKQLGDKLATQGIAVLGVDALRYFWSRRSPERVGGDLQRVIDHYRTTWRTPKVLLIGYSFGADILPFAYNRLPAEQRADILLISLLAPGLASDFEVHVTGWLGGNTDRSALPILPEATQIPSRRLQCLYGAEEAAESLCTRPELRSAEIIERPGSHHFDGDYTLLAQRILDGLRRSDPSLFEKR